VRELTCQPSETRVITLECAGNGRHTLDPLVVEGEPWRFGAVSTAEWTGVPPTKVLDRVGILPAATEVVSEAPTMARSTDAPSPSIQAAHWSAACMGVTGFELPHARGCTHGRDLR
jgi:DMSO/TMAO reductase YedYZ molybdopterin-dependent catalytic subunit